MFRDLWVDSPWWLKLLSVVLGLFLIATLVYATIDIVNEVNEPKSGIIYDLCFTPAHTELMPVYNQFPDGRGGYTTYTTYQNIYYPDIYMVYYHQWSQEKNKWLNGDCAVDSQTFHQVKIGEQFENIN